jgi:lipid II:glycine glycyltransferase (peptidoglycan interpeptide bridge formation enzyme)
MAIRLYNIVYMSNYQDFKINYFRDFDNCLDILEKIQSKSFFQSKTWLKVNNSYGFEPLLVTITNQDDQLLAYFLMHIQENNYLLNHDNKLIKRLDRNLIAMHGPSILNEALDIKSVTNFLIAEISSEEFLREFSSVSLHFNPINQEAKGLLSVNSIHQFDLVIGKTWILELFGNETEMFDNFRRDRKRNIKKALSLNLDFIECINIDQIREYSVLRNQAQKFNRLIEIDRIHFENNWNFTRDNQEYKVFLVKHSDQVLAGQAAFLSGEYLYLTGVAISPLSRDLKIPANDFLQFELIKWALSNGVKYIDFVGANPNSTDEKLIRIDDAKSSWGSKMIEYPIFVWRNKNKFRDIVLRLLLSFYR